VLCLVVLVLGTLSMQALSQESCNSAMIITSDGFFFFKFNGGLQLIHESVLLYGVCLPILKRDFQVVH